MKNITISIIALLALSSQSHAGGELLPISVYENEKVEVKVEPIEKVMNPKEMLVVEEASPWYVGVGLVAGKAEAPNHKDYTYGSMLKLGYSINKYIALEARGLATNWQYDGDKLKHVGAFVKPIFPLSDDLSLYGLVGYAKTGLSEHNAFSDTGLAYGAGLDYALNKDFGLFIDYERLLHNAPYDFDALSFGVSYGF